MKRMIERIKEIEEDVLEILKVHGKLSADKLLELRSHKDVLATSYYKALQELVKTGLLIELPDGYCISPEALYLVKKMVKAPELEVVHEIKVQIVKNEGADAVLLVNEKKVPFQVVNDMLSAALMANMQMWRHKTEQN